MPLALLPPPSPWPARRLALALALLACLGCAAPAPQSASAAPETPAQGGTLVMGSISDVDSWNEYLARRSISVSLLRRIYLGLAQETPGSAGQPPSYAPLLAESWSAGADGLSWTFRLRECQWSDGTPVSADDVRFTWQAQTSELVPWIGAASKAHIRDVEVVDQRTVTFHFTRRYPYQFADAVEGGILPDHACSGIPFAEWKEHDWSTLRIGSGPFLLERATPQQEVVLVRNPRYFSPGHPRVDRVVLRIVPDIANLLTQLRAGEIDYVEGIPPRNAAALAADPRISITTFDHDYDYLGWNGSRSPFDDVAVRRALTLAIDREALVEDLLYGFGAVGRGPVLSTWWGAAPDAAPWPYDPERARALLRERGFAVAAADGTPSATGKPLELELMTNAGNRLREEMLVKIQEQLSRVGVRVTVQPLAMGAMMQRAFAGDYDGYLGGWSFSGKVDLAPLFGSTFIPPQGNNVVQYRDPEVDRLLGALDAAATWDEMRPTLHAIQRKIYDDQPYTFLYEKKRIVAFTERLGGVEIEVPADSLAGLERFWIRP